MNYFSAIVKRCEELDTLANIYLDSLPHLDNGEICSRIYTAAEKQFEKTGWNSPEWCTSTMDDWIPYAQISKNGSLYHALGFSMASQDAHLRNLLERVEGRETKELAFPVVAEKEIVDSYTDE